MTDKELEQVSAAAIEASARPSPEFAAAVARHEQCLAEFGENDPRTLEAAYWCLILMPRTMFNELQEIANAQRH